MQPLPAKTSKKTSALLSVNDPRCLPFGKWSFVKSPIRVTMEVGGGRSKGNNSTQSPCIWCEDDLLPRLILYDIKEEKNYSIQPKCEE